MALWRREGKRSSRERVFRPILLGLVLIAVCWGFWQNNQKRLDTVLMQGLLRDEVGVLPADYKSEVMAQIKGFKRQFGVPLEIAVLRTPPPLDRHDGARIYLDIVPSQRRAYLFLPPLVRHAVGEGFVRDMEASFQQDFIAGDWRPGLLPAIHAIKTKLTEVTR